LADSEATLEAGWEVAASEQHAMTGVTVVPGQHGIDDSRSHGGE
jgi:hypothetical protein